ncbi:MAG: twin-arginine translocase TatA/TatE family subunit [Pseudanabaena frigida]|uniref:Sec-independent protein translocase protein TatA n=1 Tax=Pseudanabaena frigida TaxID=945775 RepID=A0A2W4W6Q1_9CYAN|nr:MAG: twin-arginine translocase TatA/TatE family subunit [Pseudanabaena frigida]
MNIFGIGLPEMILIMLVALLIFGPKKLPEIGRSMGKAIKGFQDASREFESEFKREADLLEQPTPVAAKAPAPEPVSLPEPEQVTAEVISTPELTPVVASLEEVKELTTAKDA